MECSFTIKDGDGDGDGDGERVYYGADIKHEKPCDAITQGSGYLL